MNPNTLRASIQEYQEPKYGMIGLYKNPIDHSTDNGLLFSGTYICLLDDPNHSDRSWFSALVRACEISPGLYGRYPGFRSPESWDDLVGVVAASVVLDLPYRKDVLVYGLIHDWNWNAVSPDTFTPATYLARFPGFLCFLRIAADVKPTILDQFAYSIALLYSAFTKHGDTSTKCLWYLMNKVTEHHSPLITFSIKLWRNLMMIRYPGGLRELYTTYYGKEHPFTIFAPLDFE